MKIDELYHWITERHSIYLKKEAGLPKPWTEDKILQQYRFCNPYRENDAVTRWIRENWRNPHASDANLWFGMVVARLVNLPGCLEEIDWPIPWDSNSFVKRMHLRRARGLNTFNSAYIVSTNGRTMDKAEYLADYVLTPMWNIRDKIAPRENDTLESFSHRLGGCIGMGTFMTGQVIADVKEAKGSPLHEAADWYTWAAPGPGSKRGLNIVLERDMETPWGKDWLPTLQLLHTIIAKKLLADGLPPLHAQDLQNCLCETFKWCKVSRGLGRPKSSYPGV